jgi:succinyl-CoA synthetase beta subunit
VAFNAKEAYWIARRFGPEYTSKFIVKAQIQASGRNQGVFKETGFKGGIHLCNTPEEVQEVAR